MHLWHMRLQVCSHAVTCYVTRYCNNLVPPLVCRRHYCPIHHGPVAVAIGPQTELCLPKTLYQSNFTAQDSQLQRGLKARPQFVPHFPVEPMDLLTTQKQDYVKFPKVERARECKPIHGTHLSDEPLSSRTSYQDDYPARPLQMRTSLPKIPDRYVINNAPFNPQTVYQSEYVQPILPPSTIRFGDKNERPFLPSNAKFYGITENKERFVPLNGKPAQSCKPYDPGYRSTEPLLSNTTYQEEFIKRQLPKQDICPAALLLVA